ncbi:unnamed protein product [Adineta steineri]|uniref:G-protein coupled receptors family 1 profile domain-containing protein n=1 Tax=Adineta steineri TaxID=433720 RepID=A0A815M6D7_9BILA|nr:unnamed protein product [Adineta steineri]CAF1617949.1 unnamed protein product [Adineta steineri]
MLPASKIIGVSSWCLLFIALAIYLTIFILVIKSRRELRDISMLLTCSTCLSAFLTAFAACVMTGSNLSTGFLLNNRSFCYAWGLFYDIFECTIYFSYCLQGFYRLCRVVFYKKKFLLSYSLYIILIIGQWLLTLILLLPPVFVGWYIHIPTETFCLVPYTYIGPEVYHILILYLIPIVSLTIVYIWITTDIRRVSQTPNLAVAAIQRQRNQRDLTVIKRILAIMGILIVLRFPTIIFMVYGIIAGSLYPLTYGIVGIITAFCLIFIGVITIKTTSYLEKQVLGYFFPQTNRVQSGPMPLNQRNIPAVMSNNMNSQVYRKGNAPTK